MRNGKVKVKGIKAIIDRGIFLRQQIKVIDSELELIKKKIRQHAEATNQSTMKSNKGHVNISPYVTTYIDPMKCWRELSRNIRTYSQVVKVQVGLLKGHLDANRIKALSSKNEVPYKVVEFFSNEME